MEEAAARFRPLFRCFCQLVASPFSPDARRAFHLVTVPHRFLPFPATTLQLMPSPFSVIASHSSAQRYLDKAMLRVATCAGADVWLHRPSFFRLSYFFFRFRPTTNFRFLLLFLRFFPFVSFPFVPLWHFSIFHRSLPLPFFLALPSYFLLRRFGNTRPIFYPFPTAFPFLYPPPPPPPPSFRYFALFFHRPTERPTGWLADSPSVANCSTDSVDNFAPMHAKILSTILRFLFRPGNRCSDAETSLRAGFLLALSRTITT